MAFEAKTPEGKSHAESRIKAAEADIARYDSEKASIKKEAEGYQNQEEDFKHHQGNFGLAVVFLQIAIMLSSVGALLKKPAMWYVGMIFGILGLVYMSGGLGGWL
jgi:hypothetical protein